MELAIVRRLHRQLHATSFERCRKRVHVCDAKAQLCKSLEMIAVLQFWNPILNSGQRYRLLKFNQL